MMLEGMDILCPSTEDFLNMMGAYFTCAETLVCKEYHGVLTYSQKLKEDFSTILKKAFMSKGENELRNFKAFATYNDVVEMVSAAVSKLGDTAAILCNPKAFLCDYQERIKVYSK